MIEAGLPTRPRRDLSVRIDASACSGWLAHLVLIQQFVLLGYQGPFLFVFCHFACGDEFLNMVGLCANWRNGFQMSLPYLTKEMMSS